MNRGKKGKRTEDRGRRTELPEDRGRRAEVGKGRKDNRPLAVLAQGAKDAKERKGMFLARRAMSRLFFLRAALAFLAS